MFTINLNYQLQFYFQFEHIKLKTTAQSVCVKVSTIKFLHLPLRNSHLPFANNH
ncbi:hypothetical protein BN1326_150071 [Staphylococcus argenteus]|uniref:Uncharacterized protein n=1 Tax=Staphylococcus argenteus TaxID=985002 RepID=A0A7U7JRG0_9STAP|nr:hypothetical protein BN1326_150071 [Staphylococcus argenteus]CRI17711.1 hypothetical protein BN1326_150071 [Staphylococcus argenteus]